jgi:Nif11 domain
MLERSTIMAKEQAASFLKELRGRQELPEELHRVPTIEAFLQELVSLGAQSGHNFTLKEASDVIADTFLEVTGSKTTLERLFSPHPLDEELEDEELEMTLRIAPPVLLRGLILGDLLGGPAAARWCFSARKWSTRKCS